MNCELDPPSAGSQVESPDAGTNAAAPAAKSSTAWAPVALAGQHALCTHTRPAGEEDADERPAHTKQAPHRSGAAGGGGERRTCHACIQSSVPSKFLVPGGSICCGLQSTLSRCPRLWS